MLRILVIATLFLTQTAFAAASDEFSRAAAQAEAKCKANPKGDYPLKVMFNISNQSIRAMEDCGPEFPLGSTYDFVLIISAAGRIERVIPGPISRYGQCIASHLRLPQTVAKPPGASWPVHVRLLHGKLTPEQQVSSIPVLADSAGTQEKPEPASSAYAARVVKIEQAVVIPALQKDVKRWGKNSIRLLYDVDRSGQMHDLRVIPQKPNPWAVETIRRALETVKFPPIPANVLNEVHSDRVHIENDIDSK